MIVRDIEEPDVARVTEIYRAVYGDDFPFQEFYDPHWVKRGVFNDDIAWLVAEDDDGVVMGSAAVMLDAGDADDLIGEFGRLVVHPECRSRGVGTALVRGQVDRAGGRVEWGFAECRTVHPGAQKICEREGFRTVGFEPLAYRFGSRRESPVFMARFFGDAPKLRRNNPRVIASVYPIGCQALQNLGLDPDLIVVDDSAAYVEDDDLTVEELRGEHAYRLLRIGSGRAWDREICGGMRLDYGFLKLVSHSARYLVARRGDVCTGAIGYVHDPMDDKVRIFELIAADDGTKGALLHRFSEQVVERHGPVYIDADVNAHSPRMQATLEQLGFFPAGFCPAMVFEGVERLDIVKMAKLSVPWGLGDVELVPSAQTMRDLVQHAFEELHKGRTICDVARQVHVFRGLGDREIARVRGICRERRYGPGEAVFRAGDPSKELYVVMEGTVGIVAGEEGEHELAEVGAGDVFGEMALIDDQPRSAGAVCKGDCTLLAIAYGDMHHLMTEQPELGRKVMHNLASTLSRRLRVADRRLERLMP